MRIPLVLSASFHGPSSVRSWSTGGNLALAVVTSHGTCAGVAFARDAALSHFQTRSSDVGV